MKHLKSIIAILSFTLLLSTTGYAALSDISGDRHQEAIEYLEGENIINGYPDGTFRPNNNINRAEALKLIVGSANKTIDAGTYKNCFLDVKDEWFASYICYAKEQGWISGYPDGNFKPAQIVNKVEAIKMVINIHGIAPNNNINLPFNDTNSAEWYAPYLQAAYDQGLIEEESENYQPAGMMNRGATSEVLYRLLTGNSSEPITEEEPAPEEPDEIAQDENCDPLTTVIGAIITVESVTQLNEAINQANTNGNTTILIKDGTYTLDNGLWVDGNNIIIRSQSGNREAVVLQGQGMNGGTSHIFWIAGDNITIADMTLGRVGNHAIQVHGELDADVPLMHNLRIIDTMEQMIKVSSDGGPPTAGSNDGVLECSTLEYTAGIGPQYYIGGIDAHNAKDWVIRKNIFRNISSPEEDIAEYAIHFWTFSDNTLVEDNTIINSDRGIGFGLGDGGHIGGTIRGNNIYHDSSRGDVGISLENASGTMVENNIIIFENDYPNSIEYRFEGTSGGTIRNNIVNSTITSRDGGSATLGNNTTNAEASWFLNPAAGDFTFTGAIGF